MARGENSDRGLVPRKNSKGKTVYYVRLYLDGRMRWVGSFPTKKEARPSNNVLPKNMASKVIAIDMRIETEALRLNGKTR